MATRPIERSNYSTSRNIMQLDRHNFEKNFYTSLRKAINNIECPVKEKHARRVLIGTFLTKSGHIFWYHVRSLELQGNPIVCWKFCHVLHKVLRDGHPRVIIDSAKQKSWLLDLGRMWGFLKEGYGKLIENYCSLLVCKLRFHTSNPRIPGNLIISDNELDKIGENNVNVFFQLCCEIFDYMDEILCLQSNVFNSLEFGRANSMTSAGQCRLAPLILCIQDSSLLYDFTVKILFKLHSALPASTLDGHRDRFNNQFKLLKKFYTRSKNLQYFKPLIQPPELPDEPPNFFVQSNINNHVTPVAIVPDQEPIDSESSLLDLTFDDNDSDKADEASLWSFQEEYKPEVHQQNLILEKDKIIEKLMSRIGELEIENRNSKVENEKRVEDLKRSIAELECATAQRMEKEIEVLKLELEKQKFNNDAESQMTKLTEKFTKMKEFYNKLRSEHIELIRTKAECERQLVASLSQIEELKHSNETLEGQLKDNVRKEAEMTSISIHNSDLQSRLVALQEQLNTQIHKLNHVENEKQSLISQMTALNQKLEQQQTVAANLRQENERNQVKIYKMIIMKLAQESMITSKKIVDQDLELGFASVNCTPQYFCSQIQILISLLTIYEQRLRQGEYSLELFTAALQYYYQLFYTLNCSKTTIQNIANIELSDELLSKCIQFVSLNSDLTQHLDANLTNAASFVKQLNESLHEIHRLTEKAIPEFVSNKTLDLGTMLSTEMEQMDKAIQDAVHKIEQLIATANKKDTGIKLEVNGKILDACTSLMQAIVKLIHDSKQLQMEIASKGRGTSSIKEFYQRNHRWTEGLISAAKTVAADANLLVETADKIISGQGKFEELMAASQEISAACAQLVVASRVKADSSSHNLANLSSSSKLVLQATGNVIATTKHCSKLIDESDTSDFSKLSIHQAKRLEMECQVKVLELENLLEKERLRLASLRRTHYHLADSLTNNNDQ